MCPAWASLLYRRYGINLEGASPLWAGVTLRQMLRGARLEPLVSCKVANREVGTEGSRTTKLGTDEQEPDTRHKCTGKQPHHCNAQRISNCIYVDTAAIG